MTEGKRVEFCGRMVPDHYPARHAQAQSIPAYDDFKDGVTRDRIRYGDPKDRYPGDITYATRKERIECRVSKFREALAHANNPNVTERERALGEHHLEIMLAIHGEGSPEQIEERIIAGVDREDIRIDHRCADCDVDVGEFHLPGCDTEVCPKCGGQAFACGCTRQDDDENNEDDNEDDE